MATEFIFEVKIPENIWILFIGHQSPMYSCPKTGQSLLQRVIPIKGFQGYKLRRDLSLILSYIENSSLVVEDLLPRIQYTLPKVY